MQELNSPKARRPRSIPASSRRSHISDSQFQFSYDLSSPETPRPLTVPELVQKQSHSQSDEMRKQPSNFPAKKTVGRRPDGNPVTGEGYEPQHYRPSYFGSLSNSMGDSFQRNNTGTSVAMIPEDHSIDAIKTTKLSDFSSGNLSFPEPGSAPSPELLPSRERRVTSAEGGRRPRVPPGGYSDGLW